MTFSNSGNFFYIGLFLFLTLSACDGNTMQPQDKAFLQKIRQGLISEGDTIKVSDIHPGNWSKVCFTAAGAKYDAVSAVSERERVPENDLQVIHRPASQVRHGDDFDWGVYFFYPPNKIEYFEISLSEMSPGRLYSEVVHMECADRENAYFVADEIVQLKKNRKFLRIGLMAEGVGFEPTVSSRLR